LERLWRTHAARLQPIYERMPAAVRHLLISARGLALTRNRYSSAMYALHRELRSHESWSREQIRAYQLKALRETVEDARTRVPYYRSYPKLKWQSLDEIRDLPLLLREHVRGHAADLVADDIPERDLIRVSTTGTTGASLTVAYTQELMRTTWAFHLRQWSWIGIHPRNWRITFFGNRVVPPSQTKAPYWAYNLPEHQILASIFHLSENTADHYIAFLRRHQGLVLEGFPSVLGILADFMLERGQPVPMRAVFTDGEPLYPYMREKVEAAFQTKVYDAYGNTELCGMMQECEHGHMHLAPEYAFVEVLDENHQPVAEGEEGYLVWTGLVNRVTPLIRYRIGDRGCWESGSCPCGRAFPLMRPTPTRESDLLRHPDGRIFSPRALNQLLKGLSSLRFCQFVQDRPERVVVRGVASCPEASQDVLRVRIALEKLLGNGMQVSSELAREPIIRAGGKMPLIVRPAKPVAAIS
jgi:phenylacetate-coenzyme A ligase PaaK-like adenylate-forming protein